MNSSHSAHRDTLRRMLRSRYRGVAGVVRLDGTQPGPVLGVTIFTHGNEPCGLAVCQYVLSDIAKRLLKGSIILVVNNPRAAQRYFAARTDEEKRQARFIDLNMNRLPSRRLGHSTRTTYEERRARELMPIWRQFDVALDIHSTTKQSRPMIIGRGHRPHSELLRGFPIHTLIMNIDGVQIGYPTFSFYGSSTKASVALAIEAGQHGAKASQERALICTLALMQNLGMLESHSRTSRARTFVEYEVTSSIMFPDDSYEFVREFTPFHKVRKGEILAKGGGKPIRAPHDGVLLMAKSRKVKAVLTEETAFVSQPARTVLMSA